MVRSPLFKDMNAISYINTSQILEFRSYRAVDYTCASCLHVQTFRKSNGNSVSTVFFLSLRCGAESTH